MDFSHSQLAVFPKDVLSISQLAESKLRAAHPQSFKRHLDRYVARAVKTMFDPEQNIRSGSGVPRSVD